MPRHILSDTFIKAQGAPEKTTLIYDEKIKQLAIRLYPTGGKSWIYQYHLNGKSKKYTIGKFPEIDTERARRKASDLYDDVQSGVDLNVRKKKRKQQNQSITFKELIQKYKDNKYQNYKESTITSYNRVLDKYISELHDIYVSDLTKNDVTDLTDQYNRDGKSSMANYILKIVSAVLSYGKQKGFITENFLLDHPKYEVDRNEEDYIWFTYNELYEIWTATDEFKEPLKYYFKLLMLVGSRKTETLKMKWEDVNSIKKLLKHTKGKEKKLLLEIQKENPDQPYWRIPPEDTKNGKQHFIPLTDTAMKQFVQLKKYTGNSDYVFQSNVKNDAPVAELYHHAKRIRDLTGIENYHNHALRHSAGTLMSMEGITPNVIGKVLNHSEMAGDHVITSRYIHDNAETQKLQALQTYHEKMMKEFQKIENEKIKQQSERAKVEATAFGRFGTAKVESKVDDQPDKDRQKYPSVIDY